MIKGLVDNNGVKLKGDEPKKVNWNDELSISENRPLISMIANITNRKDHVTLLKAWQIVIEELKREVLPLPVLVLAGKKLHTYDQLRLLAFDLNLSDHIRFTGAINNVSSLINASLFCVFSSNLEGCPNGVLECMAQQKAVIGTNISGIRQALSERYGDYCLVNPNDPKDFASKVINLYTDTRSITEIEEFNYLRIKNDFSIDKMARSYLHLINTSKAI